MNLRFIKCTLIVLFILSTRLALAGPPFNAIEGEGGIALNPVAYLANSNSTLFETKVQGLDIILSKPQIGGWYVGLEETNINWGSWSIAESFCKRLETSYGYELVRLPATDIHKHNIGFKVALLDENSFDSNFVPAISFGSIVKTTSSTADDVHSTGADFYLVTTKLITQLPRPVLLSGGALLTQGRVNGILGFGSKWSIVGFGNIDLLVLDNLALGFEIKQGPEYGHAGSGNRWKDSNYLNAHFGWMVTKNLTLIGAYLYTGDEKSNNKVGLGNGFVLSAQYAF